MGKKTDFAVYRTNHDADYTMAYDCAVCGKPVVGYGNDPYGTFSGVCQNGHRSTMTTS